MLQMSVLSKRLPLRNGFLTIALFAGCGESPQDEASPGVPVNDVEQHIDADVDRSRDAISPARAEFLSRLKTRLKSIDERIELLAKKEQDLSEEARIEWNRKVHQLEIRGDAARRRLKTLSEASESGWSDLRDGAEAAWQDLDKAVDDAMAK